jgi:hypothetical protein
LWETRIRPDRAARRTVPAHDPAQRAPTILREPAPTGISWSIRCSRSRAQGGKTAGQGGGILSLRGQLELTDSPIVDCSATGRGGGVAHEMLAGDDPADGTTIVNSTDAYDKALMGWQL